MRRRLLTSAAVVSALLGAAVVAAAVRSRGVGEGFVYRTSRDAGGRAAAHVVDVVHGAATYGYAEGVPGAGERYPDFQHKRVAAGEVADPGWRAWVWFIVREDSGWTTVSVPLWVLAAPCLVAPARWLILRRRDRRRRREERCVACGYDLRATPARRSITATLRPR